MTPDTSSADHRPASSRRADTRARLPDPLACLPRFGGDDAPPQFAREDQAFFLDCLAQCGNVLAAARRTGVSRSTVYRMRRACPRFADLWDAALLLARPQVEAVLADRAINGVEETVYYHGEAIATRRRYDSRLLLAHLARLDRLAERCGEDASPADFEHALNALESAREVTFVAAGDAGDAGGAADAKPEDAGDAPCAAQDDAAPAPDAGCAPKAGAAPDAAPAQDHEETPAAAGNESGLAQEDGHEDGHEEGHENGPENGEPGVARKPDGPEEEAAPKQGDADRIFSSQDTVSGVSGLPRRGLLG